MVRLLESNQWRLVRQRGSHRAFRPPVKPIVVTVPGNWNDDLPIGTFKSILRKGATLPETKRNIREAIQLHLEAMREVGEAIPDAITDVDFVELEPVS